MLALATVVLVLAVFVRAGLVWTLIGNVRVWAAPLTQLPGLVLGVVLAGVGWALPISMHTLRRAMVWLMAASLALFTFLALTTMPGPTGVAHMFGLRVFDAALIAWVAFALLSRAEPGPEPGPPTAYLMAGGALVVVAQPVLWALGAVLGAIVHGQLAALPWVATEITVLALTVGATVGLVQLGRRSVAILGIILVFTWSLFLLVDLPLGLPWLLALGLRSVLLASILGAVAALLLVPSLHVIRSSRQKH